MNKVVIKILQRSVVAQMVLGGITINPPVANFLFCIHAKNYENWLRAGKVNAMKIMVQFSCRTRYNYRLRTVT